MRQRRGIYLISTLLVVVAVAMFVGASIALGPAWLGAAANTEDRASARLAAEAGVEYAVCRLRERADWRGDGPTGGSSLVANLPDFLVKEDNGNVVGLVRENDGRRSLFRLRFNHYDGAGGTDGLPDPVSLRYDGVFLSFNNLAGNAGCVVPYGDPAAGYAVTAPTVGDPLASRSVGLSVEGLAGPAIQSMNSPDDPVPAAGRRTAVTVQTVYFNTLGQPVTDAAVMSGGSQTYLIENGQNVELKAKSGLPRLRSRRSAPMPLDAKITVQQRDSTSGEFKTSGADLGTQNGNAADVAYTLVGTATQHADTDDFYNLKWADVTKADSTAGTSTAMHIPAGTYVVWDDNTLHYYDMDFTAYKTLMASDPTNGGVQILSDNLSEIRNSTYGVDPGNVAAAGDKLTINNGRDWSIQKDTFVQPTPSGATGFTLIPRQGFAASPGDTTDKTGVAGSYDVNDLKFDVKNTIFSLNGDLRVGAEISSTASTLTAAGEIRLDSKDYNLSGFGNEGLNVYGLTNIMMSSYQEATNKFGKIDVKGLLYTQGLFKAVAGHPGSLDWGDFQLKGALVSYGGDPATGVPGSASGGVDIAAKSALLEWDAKELGNLNNYTAAVLKLERASYAIRQ